MEGWLITLMVLLLQFSEADRKVILCITSAVNQNVAGWTGASFNVLHCRPVVDKITLVAMEILMLQKAYFTADEDQVRCCTPFCSCVTVLRPGKLFYTISLFCRSTVLMFEQ